jgi:hypothetical protein
MWLSLLHAVYHSAVQAREFPPARGCFAWRNRPGEIHPSWLVLWGEIPEGEWQGVVSPD